MAEFNDTRTYYAKSVFSDPLVLLFVVMLALDYPEVRAIIPVAAMPYVVAGMKVGGILLRIGQAVRPVAFIAPGGVKPVEVKSIEPKNGG
jgi:hypothetical protein